LYGIPQNLSGRVVAVRAGPHRLGGCQVSPRHGVLSLGLRPWQVRLGSGSQPLAEHLGLVLEPQLLSWGCRRDFYLGFCEQTRQRDSERQKRAVQIG
jgi:hypothetical protein